MDLIHTIRHELKENSNHLQDLKKHVSQNTLDISYAVAKFNDISNGKLQFMFFNLKFKPFSTKSMPQQS